MPSPCLPRPLSCFFWILTSNLCGGQRTQASNQAPKGQGSADPLRRLEGIFLLLSTYHIPVKMRALQLDGRLAPPSVQPTFLSIRGRADFIKVMIHYKTWNTQLHLSIPESCDDVFHCVSMSLKVLIAYNHENGSARNPSKKVTQNVALSLDTYQRHF